MKFKDMSYERPDVQKLKDTYAALTERLSGAASYDEARQAFLDRDAFYRSFDTTAAIAHIRHSIDTRDAFYDAEERFWNSFGPELEEYEQAWTAAMLAGPFRADFEAEFGSLLFLNAEIALKTFSPEIIPRMQAENDLAQEYEKLLASARIPFEGGTYTLSQLEPIQTDADDARRLAAWKAAGQWYKDNQSELDRMYDELVRLRDDMGKSLGYGGYTPLGYYRMNRNCYTAEDVSRFREGVVKYVVPLAEGIYREQAKRLGVDYPMSFADAALEFRSGNPRPVGSAEDILAHAQRFYDELSPETGEFFRAMREGELMDLLSTEGKASGGYCTSLYDYEMPFIFANFNGTQGDVEVVTHEAGHAFADYMNRHRVPVEYTFPTYESCEVHSMSMEFFAWPWAKGFFGADTDKFKYSHLSGALTFIPYGTMVDHFQHIVYENPELTPRQRHDTWRELMGVYMPWMRLDGEIPFFSEGEHWQLKHHIYSLPFYYIDYCLAQTVALQLWAMAQESLPAAWEKYMAYTSLGGSRTFAELLSHAGLNTPFDPDCLRTVCEAADRWLREFDTDML